jgi:hypothetical protein
MAFPDAVITVAVATKVQARALRQILRAQGIQAALLTSGNRPSERARVTVTTYGHLGEAEAQLHCLDLLVLLDGYAALGAEPRSYVSPPFVPPHRKVPRVIGFVPADRRPAPAERVGLVELFGPHVVEVPAHGWTKRPVEVAPVRFKGGKASWDPKTVTRKRRNLWHHRLRNRLVARLARLLAAGDRAGLLAAFPRVSDVPDLLLPARVLVVVENREHADALNAELRDWRIDEPADGWVAHEVATFDRLRSRSLDDIDVIVRADGGTGLPPIAPTALASSSSKPARPLVVVDVLDHHHPELRRAVHSRAHAYIEAGWRPAGCDAADYALLSLFPERGRQ